MMMMKILFDLKSFDLSNNASIHVLIPRTAGQNLGYLCLFTPGDAKSLTGLGASSPRPFGIFISEKSTTMKGNK